MSKYPRLELCIRLISLQTGIYTKPIWQWKWPENVEELERLASMLRDADEVDAFVRGSKEVQTALKEQYKLYVLDTFLEEVFEGPMHDWFFDDEWLEKSGL